MKKDISIQVIRVIAMLSIIICHIFQETSNKYLIMSAQFFNIGVYIFLIVSGFLYSNKKIEIKKFFVGRFYKIILPMYIFMIPVFIIQIINNQFQINKFLIYLFNLQGIFGGVTGASHLWFLTAIFICYLMLPVFQIVKKNKKMINIFNILLLGITIGVCYLNRVVGMQFVCLCTFSVGYFYFEKLYNKNINMILVGLILIIDMIFRIISKYFFDGMIIYDLIIVGISQVIASICIMLLIKLFTKNKTKSSFFINILDKYSFYLYITHYFFIKGNVSIMNVTSNFIINVIVMLILSSLYAIILYYVSNYVQQKIWYGGKKKSAYQNK